MASLKQIEIFLNSGPIAMAGVSRNPKKFGHVAFKELREKGLDLVPVNPSAAEILGTKAYPDVKSLPPEISSLLVMTRKDQTASVVKEAKEKGIRNIWIQQSSDTPEAIGELKGTGINFITGECIMMFHKPHSFHKFHRGLNRLFGRYPK
ncbi:MAG TPA: CoA-binding protein [Bacteroidales bacterium]|nr:CoA-binding protein [Bacteroidales bacterium]